jgi:phosphoenolpyruvate phosphomutase
VASSLRQRLLKPGPALLVGAHNALSARLGEEAGFDGIWASGFEISAARAVPDANILTMAETLDAAREMAEAVSIPVIADCDAGFGNAINVIRTVVEYERAGVAGICIEDNTFPKRCSFYVGVARELVSAEEHAGRIRAAISSRSSDDFLVIARTEALIAGYGMAEALNRARAYADAGADCVLVHSKATTSDELRDFAARWDRDTPLVSVPTRYKHTSAGELDELGYKVVIFANHALRASVKAMQTVLATLRESGTPASADPYIVELDEIYRLVGVERMREQEEAFMPAGTAKVRAVILAAGADDKLLPLTEDRPKCMLDVKGKTILERQVELLNSYGIKDVAVVRGYRKERVDLTNIRYFDNDDYESTGEAVSLFKAESFFDGPLLVIYGDILFEREVLEKLLRSDAPSTIVVDRSWVEHRGRGLPPGQFDLVRLAEPARAESRHLSLGEPANVTRIGRRIDSSEADGEFIGMMMLAPEKTKELLEMWHRVSEYLGTRPFQEAATPSKAAVTDLLAELIACGEEIRAVEIYKGWTEVDSFEDYRRVWADTVR